MQLNFKTSTIALKLVYVLCLPLLLVSSLQVMAVTNETVKVATIKLTTYGFIENNKKQGLFYELANAIITHAGYIPQNNIVPYSRAVQLLKSGTVDLTIMFTNKELAETAFQLSPIIKLDNIIIGLKGTEFKTLENLQGKTVAGLRNALYDTRYDENLEIRKYPTTNYMQSLKMLISGRVDAVIGNKFNILWTLKELGQPSNSLGLPLNLNSKYAYLHLSKKSNNPAIKDKIITAIKSLKQKGAIKEIITKYSTIN